MEAKEIFEKLRFTKYEDTVRIVWGNSVEFQIVDFSKIDKFIRIQGIVIMEIELLQAINQQCKELGWFE